MPGTPTAVDAEIDIPNGEAIAISKISSGTLNRLGTSNYVQTSQSITQGAYTQVVFSDKVDTSAVYFAIGGSGASATLDKSDGNAFVLANQGFIFDFIVPIEGWSSESTILGAIPSSLTKGTWDRNVGADKDSDLSASVASASAGDSIKYLTDIIVDASATVDKQVAIVGGGFGSQHTGDIVFASGSDGSSLERIYIKGTITIDSGVKNLILDNIWMDDPASQLIDNSGNNYNVITNITKVN